MRRIRLMIAVAAIAHVSLTAADANPAPSKKVDYCVPIPGATTDMLHPAAFTGTSAQWDAVTKAIAASDWPAAKVAFEAGSAYRGTPFTGAREPADTFYRRGIYGYAFRAIYQAAFCESSSTLTYADAAAAPGFRATLEDALVGRYPRAKAELAAVLAADPVFATGRNVQAMLAALTRNRPAAIADWQYAVAHGRASSLGQPNIDSIDAVEYLLYSDSKIIMESRAVSKTLPARPSPMQNGVPPAFGRFASSDPKATTNVPAFDVLDAWMDSPQQNAYSQVKYVHVRLYLHPVSGAKVQSRDFRIEGDIDGRQQTYTGLPRSAPYVQRRSYVYATQRIQSTIVPAVKITEDLGRMATLDLQQGEGKTVVVTFEVPNETQFSESQLHTVGFSSSVR